MANTFREVYKKTGTGSYQLVGNVGVGGVKLDIMKGATSESDGEIGLVPKPSARQENYILTGSGSFKTIASIINANNLIKNDLTTSTSGNILDAYQGKVLNDKINSMETQINNKANSNHTHSGLIVYKSSEVVDTSRALTWNFYTGLGYRPQCVILTPACDIGDAYLYYKFDQSNSSYIQIGIHGNPLQGNIRISIVIPEGQS